MFWFNELHPLLNKEKWTKEEDKLLLKLAEENSTGGNWDEIACELKVKQAQEARTVVEKYSSSVSAASLDLLSQTSGNIF